MSKRKPFVYQERQIKGWCGPASLAIALAAIGFEVTQEELAKILPFDPQWGSDHASMLATARRFVPAAYELIGKSLEELDALAKDNAVIVNFLDTDTKDEPFHGLGNGDDGHYVLLDGLTEFNVLVMDPNPITPICGGQRKISRKWFEDHFWDIERSGKVVSHWALVIPVA